MEFQIPLNTLFTQVFGIASPWIREYKIGKDDGKSPNLNYKNNDTPYRELQINDETEGDKAYFPFGDSGSGQAVIVKFPMAFIGEQYYVMNNGLVEKQNFDDLILPYTSVASFTRAKRITETYMSGQKGSVIEQYGWEPWSIRIQGLIIKNNNEKKQTVTEQIKALQQYEEICDAIHLRGAIFEMLKISHASILSITYPEARNLNATQVRPFEISLKSSEPFELIYNG